MKKLLLRLLLITLALPHHLLAELSKSMETSAKTVKKNKKRRKADIRFNFHDEELVDLINMLAAKKGVNIVLPTGDKAIKQKITYSEPDLLTLDEAWEKLYNILDIAGYSLIKKNDLYLIVKNGPNISREPLPIFINTPIRDLPKTDERIIYIYYLTNIKASTEFDNQLGALFKELLPPDAVYKADKTANGILLVAKAQDIKSIMEIVDAMDQTGFQERLELVRLRYTTADTVARIFNDSILKTAAPTPNNRFRAGPQVDGAAATYFSQNVRVIAEPRTNSLVVLGRVQAVERVKDFIFKYIDVQLDSGRSILHIYDLQYLDADEFAPVLQKIVESSRSGGTDQSRSGEGAQSGTERFFDQVIIRSDSPGKASDEGAEGKYFGGNKLVVAARNDDWVRIRALIETLDRPQPQVIIEVLIADLTLTDLKNLGAITRNPGDIPFAGKASAQAAMVDGVVLDAVDTSENPNAINALRGVNSDLNAVTLLPTGASSGPPFVSLPQNLAPGTGVISISDKDGRTWTTLEVLQQFNPLRILTHPHVIATNNQTATIEVGETRLVTDQAAPSTSGITVRNKNLEANTTVKITPRISSANTVNLQVVININKFISATDFANGDRINRDLITNASVKSGDILALGGLISDETDDTIFETPILCNIPVLGWLFKQKAKRLLKTSLNIFITPTIIQPKLRGGVSEYTRENAQAAKNYTADASLFDNLRDPITRWFFYTTQTNARVIDNFLDKDATQDLSRPEVEFSNILHEDELLDNPSLYDKTGNLKEKLSFEENPLQARSESREIGNIVDSMQPIAAGSSQAKKATAPQTKKVYSKPAPKKTKIIPPVRRANKENNIPNNIVTPNSTDNLNNNVGSEMNSPQEQSRSQEIENIITSAQSAPAVTRTRTKKTKIIPPIQRAKKERVPKTQKTRKPAPAIPAPALKRPCPVPAKKPVQACAVIKKPEQPKKWPPRKAKQDLKALLALEQNPLQISTT